MSRPWPDWSASVLRTIQRTLAQLGRSIRTKFAHLGPTSSPAFGFGRANQTTEPVTDYETWRDRFLAGRLRLSLWIVLLATMSFMPLALLSEPDSGIPKILVFWIFLLIETALIVCLVVQATPWGRRHSGLLFLGFSWSVTLSEQICSTVSGIANPDLVAWSLVFLTQATLMPVRWPLHLISQVGLLSYCFVLNPVLGVTQLPDGQDLFTSANAAVWLYLFWFCFICDLAVYMYERLQRSEFEARQQIQVFLHGVSHDLRNPVTGTSMVINSLLKQTDKVIPVPRSILERMAQGSDRQLSLINSLLEAHSSEVRGVICRLEPIELHAVVQSAIVDLEPLISKNQATLKNSVTADLPLIQADSTQLWRVFTNIITNAINHNPPGLTIYINATLGPDKVRCSIEDNGVGMTKDQSDRIFELYARSSQIHQSIGLGLGLYLARQIIEAHGGKIGVTSNPGEGALFWFTLPLAH